MTNNNEIELPIISTFSIDVLTNMSQLIDNTSNDVFSFEDKTSETELVRIVFPSIEKLKECMMREIK